MLALALSLVLAADDWPHWRGPQRNGVSAETGWLDRWPAGGPKVAWKAEVGIGFSSFAVAKGRAFTVGNNENTDTVFCFDAETGKPLWSHAYPSDLGDKFYEGGSVGTPTVDGDRVYWLGKWGDLFCFEAATGKVAWSKNVQKEAGMPVPDWGYSGSCLVLGDLLILNVGEAGLAVGKADGKIAWKSAAKDAAYSTPYPAGPDGPVLMGSVKSYLAVDPRTGREAWRVKWVTSYGANAADPIVDGDRVFLSTGYGKGAALLGVGKGEPAVVWESKVMNTQMNPCVLVEGHLYGVDGDAGKRTSLKCVEFATGAQKWAQPIAGGGSVAAADGRLLVLSGEGELSVGPASPEGFTPTARARVLDGKCWTVPVLANGRIYARSAEGRVVCLDVRKP